MAEIIRPSDPVVMERCRATGTAWVELASEDREVYERVHNRLLEIAEDATARANVRGSFKYSLTSGFTVKSGVRGSQPKDLWFAIHRSDAAMGMPQLYMIVSARGVEYGFAPAIHPSDFSSQSYKEKLRSAIPAMFASLPDRNSEVVRELSTKLELHTGWYYRRKTRQDPFQNNFRSFDELIGFLHSTEGVNWGAAAVCRYVSPNQLEDPSLDLKKDFGAALDLFLGFLTSIPAPATQMTGVENQYPNGAALAETSSLQTLLSRFFEIFAASRQHPFQVNDELWQLMRQLSASFGQLPSLTKRAQIKIQWSVGRGEWAGIPWIAFVDQTETKTTQKGLYGAILFRGDLSGCYLTLNQGVMAVTDVHPRSEARKILRERADQFRKISSTLRDAGFCFEPDLDPRTERDLGADYQASTIAYKFYPREAIPSDKDIAADLEALLFCYNNILQSKGTTRRSWIFQANPKYYDVDGAIAELNELSWLVNQYASQIHKDDEVFLWKSGPQGGIVGTATIITDPDEIEATAEDKAFNKQADKFEGQKTRVRLRIDNVIDPPITRTTISSRPSLAQLQILKMAQNTNSPVTPEEAQELWSLIERPERPEITEVPVRQRVWLVAAGRNADRWEEFFRNGYIAIGWLRLGDLSRFASRDEIANELKMLGSETSSSNDAASCYDFVHSMQEGDLVRAGPGCLNRISASISGASAGVRPPSGLAAG